MDAVSQIAQAREAAERATKDLLNTLSFVPDDKLPWSPSPTSRSPLWIAGHCGGANQAFATGIRGEILAMPEGETDFSKMVWETGRGTATREEAVRSVEESTAAVLAALDALTPEAAAGMVQTPLGPMPMAFWITIPGLHMMGHARQLDYLQTIWGDIHDHMTM